MTKPTVYSKPNCAQCEMVKRELKKLNIDYNEESLIDPKNAELLEIFKAEGLKTAPITIIGDEKISGFNPLKLKKALGL